MSTVKIKTEPTATVDVQVKLEPSLSTGDIKLEQHTSDIDTKVEYASEEEDDVKSENDDDSDEDIDQNQVAATSKNQRQFICNRPGCGRRFNFTGNLRMHQHEHKLQTELSILGKIYTLARQSLDDRWSCPLPDCELACKTVNAAYHHIRKYHNNILHQGQQNQQLPDQLTKLKFYYFDADDFYVNGTRCGYHNTIGVFICYDCRLVPECLLSHLQQKHGYDKKSINTAFLPESAVNATVDPSVNQHTSNSLLAAAISQSYQPHHRDIIQGWLCITSDCGYCGYATHNKFDHKRIKHQGEQLTTVPALVLRLSSSKRQSSCFLITRIDQASGAVMTSGSRVSQRKLDYNHNGLDTQDESEDGVSQNETTEAFNQKRQWRCEYQNCGRFFNTVSQLAKHRREHKLEAVVNVRGMTYILSRQSSGDRWPCPIPVCDTTCKTISYIREHILNAHSTSIKHKRASSEDGNGKQQNVKKTQRTTLYLNVDDFYVSTTRCGYQTTTRVFLCHTCRLVPECLLTHLQQTHGYNEKSIDNSALPESALAASADPNVNQHTSNSYLASAIRQPYWQHRPDIVQGWLCVTSNCGYCYSTKKSRNNHKYTEHRGEQLLTVPALVLRLFYAKTQTSFFLITQLDTITDSSANLNNSASQHIIKCDDEDGDGDELVLSDYSSDEDDIH